MLPTELMLHIGAICDQLRLSYFVTGSMASSFYGEMRSTRDVDVVVELPPWRTEEFCRLFPQPDWYVSPAAAVDAANTGGMFNILHQPSGLKVDVICLSDTPF